MKREFLKSFIGKEVDEEIINQIFAEYGKAVNERENKISSLTTEVETLKTQAKETDDKIKELTKENWEDKYKELETKYSNDTKELEQKLSKTNYDNKIEKLVSELTFSSESAKKGFMADLKAKELKLDGDNLLGFSDFVDSYKENDPSAFKNEVKEEPKAVASTGTGHEENNVSDNLLRQAMGL